jgi:hypothetical protein
VVLGLAEVFVVVSMVVQLLDVAFVQEVEALFNVLGPCSFLGFFVWAQDEGLEHEDELP